jgi:tRNA modification GTPase
VFSAADTIVAIATPPGRGGLGVIRISGPQAHEIASALLEHHQPLEPRRATLTRTRLSHRDEQTTVVDDVVATFFPAPHSYTGQDVVEIGAHGSPVVLHAIVRSAIDAGARLARPGEFTLRAFLGGKMNLVQAEAVADLIDAATPLQARVAFDQLEGTLTRRIAEIDGELFDLIARLEASLDFPDEGYHFVEPGELVARIGAVIASLDALLADARQGRTIRDGATVVIAGRPNVGKSSIFNRLLGSERAIVTAVPGTTRDLVTERVDLDGLMVTLVDTAGDRGTEDIIEREGVSRAARARGVADLVVVVIDQSEDHTADDERILEQTRTRPRLVVANKCDRPSAQTAHGRQDVTVSAETGQGMNDLRQAIVRSLTGKDPLRDRPALSNTRHIALLANARECLSRARIAAELVTPEEFVVTDLQEARACFDEVVGTRTSEDVLAHIFERFCIGK